MIYYMGLCVLLFCFHCASIQTKEMEAGARNGKSFAVFEFAVDNLPDDKFVNSKWLYWNVEKFLLNNHRTKIPVIIKNGTNYVVEIKANYAQFEYKIFPDFSIGFFSLEWNEIKKSYIYRIGAKDSLQLQAKPGDVVYLKLFYEGKPVKNIESDALYYSTQTIPYTHPPLGGNAVKESLVFREVSRKNLLIGNAPAPASDVPSSPGF